MVYNLMPLRGCWRLICSCYFQKQITKRGGQWACQVIIMITVIFCISLPRVWAALPFANSKTPISSREAPSRSHTCWSLREARVALQWLIVPSVPRTESLTQYLSSINLQEIFRTCQQSTKPEILRSFQQSWGAAKERAFPPLVEHTTPQVVPLID